MRTTIVLLGAVAFLFQMLPGCSGCNDSSSSVALPCEGPDPDPLCGTDCDDDEDCGPDLYCGADDTCTADCAVGGNHCQEGETCGAHGRCIPNPDNDGGVDGSGRDAESCGDITVSLTPVIPIIQILIDQSGSMTTAFGDTDRWDAVHTALTDPTEGAVTLLADRVQFGATLYTSNGGADPCPTLTTVEPILNNYQAIEDLLASNGPSGDTPTGESITGVVPILKAVPQDPDGTPAPLVILLATDGEPDTCAEPNPQNGQDEAVAAAQDAYDEGVLTYILSVGDEVSDEHLQDMANAGVGLDPDGPVNEPFYVANSPSELVNAINEIIRGTRTCVFTLNGTVVMELADQGVVRLNGEQLEYQTEWQMNDEHTLELLGEACETFLNEDTVSLSAVFPCDVVVVR